MIVTPCAAYVVVGTVEVCVPIPPGHRIVGLACGRPPKVMPFPRNASEVTIEAIEWDTLSDAAMDALPVVLLVVPQSEVGGLASLSQDDADTMHNGIIMEWAQDTSAGSA